MSVRLISIILCVLTLLPGCGDETALQFQTGETRSAIVNGDIETGFPGVGAMTLYVPRRFYSGSFCTGALIDPRWVLTAAHCIEGAREQAQMGRIQFDDGFIHFFVGNLSYSFGGGLPTEGEFHQARRSYIHPGYSGDERTGMYDIALVELESPVQGVDPYPIYRDSIEDFAGRQVRYVGFGASDGGGNGRNPSGSGRKRSTNAPVSVVAPTFYTTNQMESGVCFGDSGGPGLIREGGIWRVIGVNSSVAGEQPACRISSTQARVDAYVTWIDSVMGENVNCANQPGLCACDAACTNGGFCDNALCAEGTCSDLADCYGDCNGNDACSAECLGASSPTARTQFSQLSQCAQERCAGANNNCVQERCGNELRTCFGDRLPMQGNENCNTVYQCMQACQSQDCVFDCYERGTAQAQTAYQGIADCIRDNCSAFENDPQRFNQCTYQTCANAFRTCMPPDNCNITGGNCRNGTACYPENWGATYCRPTQGLPVGDRCSAAQVACEDGSFCWNIGGGAICQENCVSDRDCSAEGATCDLYNGAPIEFGACVVDCPDADGDQVCDPDDCAPDDATISPNRNETCGDGIDNDCDQMVDESCEMGCPDADNDGACDPDDCAPENSAINPGAEERCGDEVDNNCNGQIDEGCENCIDEDADGYCSDVDCNDENIYRNPGMRELCGNGFDDNCNGEIDEGCISIAGADSSPADSGCSCDVQSGDPTDVLPILLGLVLWMPLTRRRG